MAYSAQPTSHASIRARYLGLVVAIQVLCIADAGAMSKCEVEGRIVYQDTPCAAQRRTAAQDVAYKEHLEVLHRKLDHLASLGHGMRTEKPANPPPPPKSSDDEPRRFIPRPRRSYEERLEESYRKTDELNEKARETNARSAASLTRILDDIHAVCGDRYADTAKEGMSDENFRNCTTQARFGGVTQIVVSKDGAVPLRLYIFPHAPRRVYSVDGVITAVRP